MSAATSNNVQVSVERASGLERRMTVRVPSAEIEREIDARLAKMRRTARLRGFRPGKVPPKVVRQRYGGQVREEVLSEVIRSSYSHAIEREKLNPAGGPRIEPLTSPGGAGGEEHFSYRAVFEVYPEIALKALDALAIDLPKVDIQPSDVDAMIEKLRAQRADWTIVDRKAQPGDRAVLDFAGTIDKQAFEGGEGKEVPIVVGSGEVVEDFDKALKGLSAGDRKSVKVKFPKDYSARHLAGKKAVFDITVLRVEEKVLPAVDAAFIESYGVKEGGLEALTAEVRSNMQRELEERIRAEIKTRCFDALIGANKIAVPRALVEQESARLQADSMQRLGIQDPQHAPPRERFRDFAERRVTVSLLVQELIRAHELEVDQARVEKRIAALASAYEQHEEAARFYRSNRELMAQVESAVLEDQLVDLILEHARTRDKVIGFHEFVDGRA